MTVNRSSNLRQIEFNEIKAAALKSAPVKNVAAENNSGKSSLLGEYNLAGQLPKTRLLRSVATYQPPSTPFQPPNKSTDASTPVRTYFTPPAASPAELNFDETKSVSNVAYDGAEGEVYQFPDGTYWRVDRVQEEDSGFRAVVMRRVVSDGSGGYADDSSDNRAVVGFAGTNGGDDINDDIAQGLGFTPEQYDQSLAFTRNVQAEAAASGETVILTGHSLGGGLATYCSIETGLPATAVNSAPLSKNKVPDDVSFDDQITQYYAEGEILTDLDNLNPTDTRPGSHIEVEAANEELSGWRYLLNPAGTAAANVSISIKNHLLDNTAPDVAAPTRVYP